MISVRCGHCEEVFQAPETSEGRHETCPACGAVNLISSEDASPSESVDTSEFPGLALRELELNPPSPAIPAVVPSAQELTEPASDPRGIPSSIWWTLAVAAVGLFVLGIVWLMRDDWEQQHLLFLVTTSQRADALMLAGDFSAAAAQYGTVVSMVGSRPMQSVYLRGLVESAKKNERLAEQGAMLMARYPATQDAGAREAATADAATGDTAATQATSRPDSPGENHAFARTSEIPATRPEVYQAILAFQRDSEGLGQFFMGRPVVLEDDQHRWRRRQFIVWDASYQFRAQANPAVATLHLSVNARITDPHDHSADAAKDTEFIHSDLVAAIPVESQFELMDGRWVITHQSINNGRPIDVVAGGLSRSEDAQRFEAFSKLEADAFSSAEKK